MLKYYRLSHDVVTWDVDHDVSTAYCQFSSGARRLVTSHLIVLYKVMHNQSTSSRDEDWQYAVETLQSTSQVTTS